MSDIFADAIADLRDDLSARTSTPARLIASIARTYGIAPEALKNRFCTAYGDPATYAERHGARISAEREQSDTGRDKIRLAELNKKIHQGSQPGRFKVSREQLQTWMDEANSLGARWRFTRPAKYRPRSRHIKSSRQFDFLGALFK